MCVSTTLVELCWRIPTRSSEENLKREEVRRDVYKDLSEDVFRWLSGDSWIG